MEEMLECHSERISLTAALSSSQTQVQGLPSVLQEAQTRRQEFTIQIIASFFIPRTVLEFENQTRHNQTIEVEHNKFSKVDVKKM